jgi:hypothetical protein
MAKIELSNHFMFGDGTPNYFSNGNFNVARYGFIDRVALGTSYSTDNGYYKTVATTGLFASNNISMRIMKGTIPTSFSEIPLASSRYTDCLVDWFVLNPLAPYSNTSKIQVEASSNPVKLFTELEPAILSGTATWFWFISWYSETEIYTYSSFYGTVGLPESGADLIVGNTNIVQNTQYRISELLINIPSSWTY